MANTTHPALPFEGFYSKIPETPIPWLYSAPALLAGWYFLSFAWSAIFGYKVPVFGVKTPWEPTMVSNFRFFMRAGDVLNEGYNACKGKIFQFRRADTDMLVLPPKYVDDIRKLPNHVASPTVAHVHNLMGSSTNMHIILRSNLHFRTLQLKLTPNLNSLTAPMQDEVNYAVEKELTTSEDEWVTVKPYHTILDFVARVSARIFLGLPLCRNPKWLEVSTQFTENVFVSLVFLRLFPIWTHKLLSWFMPSSYRGNAYVRRAKKLLVPEILQRREQQRNGIETPEGKQNLLSWMMEIATKEESDPASLAHLEVVLSLASIHTSQMNAVHVLYDLLAHPEYLDLIRDEIKRVVAEDGPWMQWQKPAFSKLRKLDSFMRESQRFNPPTLLSMHRVLLQDAHLFDGTLLPKGAHISMAVNDIQNDPDVTPEPEKFDGFRYYRLREREGEGHLHQFSTTQERILNFGHGQNACPGRFFASLEIKIILVRLLMDYEFKFKHGNKRPENLRAHEFIFPNPDAEILMRRRPVAERLQM
ncbi:cytochrome P450 [Aspergillus steynii IBT 23096]|uniref:Cytochrome P450 n=1 Tax=Aspergillus steynii IBT 23096 TaxID=1392250 RepID=A0A2I2GEN0_9EURO|nr:cytochrome P450 [Aspergillus steynii IBT 23096]PLB51301.1 cytochrome P450 [Aspergillus steynii IBT 23096]